MEDNVRINIFRWDMTDTVLILVFLFPVEVEIYVGNVRSQQRFYGSHKPDF